MRAKSISVRPTWESMTTGVRLWWAACAAIGLAAVVILGSTLITSMSGSSVGAVAPSGVNSMPTAATSGGATKPSTVPASGTAMAASSGSMSGPASASTPTAGTSSMSSGSTGRAPVPTVCPEVSGTTTMANGMVMAPVTPGPPTAAQQSAADRLVAQTAEALAQYSSLSAAEASGYVPATDPNGYVVHYANWHTVASGDVLDPNHPSSLVYANTVAGPVLLGAMYMGPAPCRPGPDVGGSLTQWHAHVDLCLSATHQVIGKSSSTGVCASGTHNTNTYFMLHVWTAPSLASSYQFAADLPSSAVAPIIRTGQP